MNALIFLVPEDIVDVRPRLVRSHVFLPEKSGVDFRADYDVRWKLDGHRLSVNLLCVRYG